VGLFIGIITALPFFVVVRVITMCCSEHMDVGCRPLDGGLRHDYRRVMSGGCKECSGVYRTMIQ